MPIAHAPLARSSTCWIFLAIAISGIACDLAPEGQGPGGRSQRLALAPDDELELGREAYKKLLSGEQVLQSGEEVDQVRRVSRRIAKAVQIEPLQREINLHVADYPFEWQYSVIEEDQINAFCLPGGKIGVFSGLLRVVANDDQLAAVIAHEVAHALAHHTSERIERERESGGGFSSLSFDREQESEADHIGVFLMTFAGYRPEEALAFWNKMQSAHGRGLHLPEILSDHPSDSRRIDQLQAWAPLAKAAKQAYDAGRIVPASGRRR